MHTYSYYIYEYVMYMCTLYVFIYMYTLYVCTYILCMGVSFTVFSLYPWYAVF